jgi:cytochrome c2
MFLSLEDESKNTHKRARSMNSNAAGISLVVAVMAVSAAQAQDDDLAAGEKLYASQCKVCHGLVSPPTGDLGPGLLQPQAVHLAMQQSERPTMRDIPAEMTSGSSVSTTISAWPGEGPAEATRIAVAPPYGPNLRGVYGRPAGTIEGFVYSIAFLKSLKGMEWNDAALDVWITNPQKWVPGVYMFYKQADAEVRRKIILYLKAN